MSLQLGGGPGPVSELTVTQLDSNFFLLEAALPLDESLHCPLTLLLILGDHT